MVLRIKETNILHKMNVKINIYFPLESSFSKFTWWFITHFSRLSLFVKSIIDFNCFIISGSLVLQSMNCPGLLIIESCNTTLVGLDYLLGFLILTQSTIFHRAYYFSISLKFFISYWYVFILSSEFDCIAKFWKMVL